MAKEPERKFNRMFLNKTTLIKLTTLIGVFSTILFTSTSVYAKTDAPSSTHVNVQKLRRIHHEKFQEIVAESNRQLDITRQQQERANKAKQIVERVAAETLGQSIDLDGAYGAQCYDFANYYVRQLGSQGFGGGSSRAGYIGTEFKSQFEAEGLTVIETPTQAQLQAGDMISIAPGAPVTDPYYGHVAIVLSVNSDGTVTTLEQNAELGQIIAKYTRVYANGHITSLVRK